VVPIHHRSPKVAKSHSVARDLPQAPCAREKGGSQ
jgi:hypothetical protein